MGMTMGMKISGSQENGLHRCQIRQFLLYFEHSRPDWVRQTGFWHSGSSSPRWPLVPTPPHPPTSCTASGNSYGWGRSSRDKPPQRLEWHSRLLTVNRHIISQYLHVHNKNQIFQYHMYLPSKSQISLKSNPNERSEKFICLLSFTFINLILSCSWLFLKYVYKYKAR